MAKSFVVSIPHSLGKQEVLRRVKSGFPRLTGNIPLVEVEDQGWIADQLSFRVKALGQICTGILEVAEDVVRLELTLPLLLQKFAPAIEGALTQGTRKLLEQK